MSADEPIRGLEPVLPRLHHLQLRLRLDDFSVVLRNAIKDYVDLRLKEIEELYEALSDEERERIAKERNPIPNQLHYEICYCLLKEAGLRTTGLKSAYRTEAFNDLKELVDHRLKFVEGRMYARAIEDDDKI